MSVLRSPLVAIPGTQFGYLSISSDFLSAYSSLLVLWLSKEELNGMNIISI